MQVILTQHAVGQGGLMSGLIEIDGGSFHWVYDCGSNQLDALKREIKIVSFQPIDVLFLSHLDSDHINGINDLCAVTDVDEVVLPYLDDLDRLIAAARADAEGRYRGNFANFLQDIPGWFKERGVKKITFINPRNDDDEEGSIPEYPRGIDGGGKGEIKKKWTQTGDNSTLDEKTPSLDMTLLDTSAAMLTSSKAGLLNWVLSPYAHKPSKAKYSIFRASIKKLLKKDETIRELLVRFKGNEAVRESIRNAYDDIWRDHNLVSMALYTGPIRRLSWTIDVAIGFHALHRRFSSSVGWLSTGDMNLKRKRRRRKLLSYFGNSNLLDLVYALQLPHHGSHNDFDSELLQVMQTAEVCYAASGPNGYGHPSPLVENTVRSLSRNYFHVDHNGHSTLRVILKED